MHPAIYLSEGTGDTESPAVEAGRAEYCSGPRLPDDQARCQKAHLGPRFRLGVFEEMDLRRNLCAYSIHRLTDAT